MRGSYLFVGVLSSAGLLVGLLNACGDSVTAVDDSTTKDAGTKTNDSGGSTPPPSSTFTPPPPPSDEDSGVDAGIDAAGVDGGLPGIFPESLDFGQVDCGTTAEAKTFTISNPSASSVPWTVTLTKGNASAFTVSPASGTLGPGEAATVTVTPKAVPTSSSTAANGITDTVTVGLGSSSPTVTLKETAHGAVLFYNPPGGVNFGKVPTTAGPQSLGFAVANSGNAPAHVTLSTTGDAVFGVQETTAVTVNPGTTTVHATFAPADLVPYAGAVTMAFDPADVVCAVKPTDLPLAGTGTDSVLTVSPNQILFGNNGFVDCGSTAAPVKVHMVNNSNKIVNYTFVLDQGTKYYTTTPVSPSPGGGSIAANGSADITVTPKAIPGSSVTTLGFYNDMMHITTDAAGDSQHDIVLGQTAHGAILTRGTGGLSFNGVPINTTSTIQYTFANTGNQDITVTQIPTFPQYTLVTPVTISAGGSALLDGKFRPTVVQPYTDSAPLTMVTTVPLCGGLPGNLGLSGSGVANTVAFTPPSYNFGPWNCSDPRFPTPVVDFKDVSVKNNGPATHWKAKLTKGGTSQFTIAGLKEGDVDEGQSFVVRIQPLPVPFGMTSIQSYTDTLEVTTDNTPVATTMSLSMSAQGAIIVFNKTSIAYGSVSVSAGVPNVQTVQVNNNGNITAPLAFSTSVTTGTNPYSSGTASTNLAAGTLTTVNVSFLPTATGAAPAGKWKGDPGTTVLCNTFPPDVTLSGTGTP